MCHDNFVDIKSFLGTLSNTVVICRKGRLKRRFASWFIIYIFRGFSIDIMAGFTVLFGSMLQIPLSTTHCKVSLLLLVFVFYLKMKTA